jgi:hypothetical protein
MLTLCLSPDTRAGAFAKETCPLKREKGFRAERRERGNCRHELNYTRDPKRRAEAPASATAPRAHSSGRRNTSTGEIGMTIQRRARIDLGEQRCGRRDGLRWRDGRTISSFGHRLQRVVRVRQLRSMPGCRRPWAAVGSGGQAACHRHIFCGLQSP